MVSHNIASINNLCERAILLDRGRITHMGKATEMTSIYQAQAEEIALEGNVEQGLWERPSEAEEGKGSRARVDGGHLGVHVVPRDRLDRELVEGAVIERARPEV